MDSFALLSPTARSRLGRLHAAPQVTPHRLALRLDGSAVEHPALARRGRGRARRGRRGRHSCVSRRHSSRDVVVCRESRGGSAWRASRSGCRAPSTGSPPSPATAAATYLQALLETSGNSHPPLTPTSGFRCRARVRVEPPSDPAPPRHRPEAHDVAVGGGLPLAPSSPRRWTRTSPGRPRARSFSPTSRRRATAAVAPSRTAVPPPFAGVVASSAIVTSSPPPPPALASEVRDSMDANAERSTTPRAIVLSFP